MIWLLNKKYLEKKIMKFLKYMFLLMFCCLFNACSTAYYSTQTDPQNYFNKQEPLTIILGETPTITEKKSDFY